MVQIDPKVQGEIEKDPKTAVGVMHFLRSGHLPYCSPMVSLTCLLQESVLLNEGPNPDTQPSSLERKKAGEDLSKKQSKDAEVRLHDSVIGACQLVPAVMPHCTGT